jgi:hypothetical protein
VSARTYNSAFALTLARSWAVTHDDALVALIDRRARDWFGRDRDCQAWEPGGDDFLSSALMEAECMRTVLPRAEFRAWLAAFLPRLAAVEPVTLFTPAVVSDRSDGKIAHLDGLNLSRAWCWRTLAETLDEAAPEHAHALRAVETHLDAATDTWPRVCGRALARDLRAAGAGGAGELAPGLRGLTEQGLGPVEEDPARGNVLVGALRYVPAVSVRERGRRDEERARARRNLSLLVEKLRLTFSEAVVEVDGPEHDPCSVSPWSSLG